MDTHAIQLSTLHFQISKKRTRQLCVIVTEVAVDTARLMNGLLGDSK
jgi:hypothetical protein